MSQIPSIGYDIMLKKMVVVILSIILLSIFGFSMITGLSERIGVYNETTNDQSNFGI